MIVLTKESENEAKFTKEVTSACGDRTSRTLWGTIKKGRRTGGISRRKAGYLNCDKKN